jgi:hypothetical protein
MTTSARHRILDPFERFSEILFGLIMVLSFTCALSIAEVGKGDVRTMLICAIGCNLAWGIIDAAFYLIGCLAERGRNISLLRSVQQSTDPAETHRTIADTMPLRIAEALQPADFERIGAHLKQLPASEVRPSLTGRDWLGGLGVFLLVFLSTFPVVIPFLFIRDVRFALHVSNGVAIAMLFGVGQMLARHAGMRRFLTGLVMVAIGAVLVALTIALGG